MYKDYGREKTELILPLLPEKAAYEIKKLLFYKKAQNLNEIRLRAGGIQSFVISGEEKEMKNVALTEEDIAKTVYKLCSGSVYAHSEELKKGYISFCGMRIGVCGKTLYGEKGICGFSKYTSLNIRIPCHIPDAAGALFEHISKNGTEKTGGILVISPPCGGKTTFLRAFASGISKGYYENGKLMRKRVCVIDEREEIFLPGVFDGGYADILLSYPKIDGIELCTRVMSPEYIICDEIANIDEAAAVLDSASRGINFAASCHGRSISDVMKKTAFKKLFDEGVFKTVCEIYPDGQKRRVEVKSVL
jgi:stage III sporulation protein AA